MCSDFRIDIDKTGPICRSVRYGGRAENISKRKLINYERNQIKIGNAGPGGNNLPAPDIGPPARHGCKSSEHNVEQRRGNAETQLRRLVVM